MAWYSTHVIDMHTSHPRPLNLILIGPPGSGKGTQAELLVERFALYHLATGDLFRAIRAHAGTGDVLADEVKARYDAGIPQPDHVAVELVERELERLHRKTGFVFDAFPLSVPQAIALEASSARLDMRPPLAVSIQVSREEAVRRLGMRRYCPVDQHVYHPNDAAYQQNRCEACGGALLQRPDDTTDLAKKRYDTYVDRIAKMKDFYREHSRLLEVNGEQPIQGVFREILQALVPYL